MDQSGDVVIRLSPAIAEISVEQYENGTVRYKTVSPETLMNCFWESRLQREMHPSGFLPEHCIAVSVGEASSWYFICCPQRFENISSFGKEYEHFPLPQLAFGFCREAETGRISQARLCVASEKRLSSDSPTFHYPFSNLYGDGRICIGRNTLPIYKDPSRLHTLAGYILRMPNNNDNYSAANNRLKLQYRDLLEHLKDKDPSYYYSDILIPDGKTLGNFISKTD